MKIISHRGNLNGPNIEQENKPEYIIKALKNNFYVEIDVWFIDNNFYLGHDKPQYLVKKEFLQNNKFYCHAKNLGALNELIQISNLTNCFSHDKDDYVITSNNKIWAYPGKPLNKNTICCMPELNNIEPNDCYGICSDFPIKYNNLFC